MAQDLLLLTIDDFIREGKLLPAPSRRRGSKFRAVPLPILQAAKVDLYKAFLNAGIRKEEFARRSGLAKSNFERLFSLRQNSSLDHIEAGLQALGKRLYVEARNAA